MKIYNYFRPCLPILLFQWWVGSWNNRNLHRSPVGYKRSSRIQRKKFIKKKKKANVLQQNLGEIKVEMPP